MFQTYMGTLNTVMEWITRFFVVQLIWILFCLLGLVLGGIFPAAFTMFAICRKWINKQTEFPIFRTFWNLYRASFLKANILGWLMVITGYSLYYYLQFFRGSVIFYVVLAICIVYLMTLLFVIPVFVHFDIKLFSVIKYASIIAISHPFQVISMSAVIAGFSMVIIIIPGLFPFFSFSLLAFALMWLANTAFVSMERKASKVKETNGKEGSASQEAKVAEI